MKPDRFLLDDKYILFLFIFGVWLCKNIHGERLVGIF